MNNSDKLAIFSMHPIPYNSHIYRYISKIYKKTEVIYLDDLGLAEYYNPYFKTKYKNDYDLLYGHSYKFLKNLNKKNNITGFFSRINFGLVNYFIKNKNIKFVMINGYQTFSSWLILFLSIIFNKKIIFKGESIKIERSFFSKILIHLFFLRVNLFLYSCKGNYKFYKSFNIKNFKLVYGPCSVDYEYFQLKKNQISNEVLDEFKKKIKFKENLKTIVFVSKFIPRKNPLELLKAIIPIKSQVQIIFVGDGPLKNEILEFAKLNFINICLSGFLNQSELPIPYMISDLYVNTSLYDASPKTLNEALNFDLPLISSDKVGQSSDLIKNGVNGYIYQIGNLQDLTTKILMALKIDKLKIKNMSKILIIKTSANIFAKNLFNSINEI
tara:strand:+ start:882 stop:2033 length:1152 start_codon:yes stop_codon:yes gene_type:complete